MPVNPRRDTRYRILLRTPTAHIGVARIGITCPRHEASRDLNKNGNTNKNKKTCIQQKKKKIGIKNQRPKNKSIKPHLLIALQY